MAAWLGTRIYLRRQVASLVDDLRSLDASSEPITLSTVLMKKYVTHFDGQFCQADYCANRFLFTNRFLSTFHLAPRSEITITFEKVGTSLRDVAVVYTSAVFRENSPIVYVSESFCSNRVSRDCTYFAMNPHGRNVAQTWNGDVGFGQHSKPEIKRAGWELNPDCFVALRGCTNISEFLPSLWKVTAAGTVSSRVRSDSDSIAEAAQPLAD
jgi:hypothetical protein